MYFFIYNLTINGSTHVTINTNEQGNYIFENVNKKIASVRWMDEEQDLTFTQNNGILDIDFTGFPYGKMYPVRVAKAILK